MNAKKPDQTQIAIAESEFTIEKSINDGHQIQKLMAEHGKPIMKLIVALINRQAEFYNVRKEITETQAAMIAQTLVYEYGVENIEDIVLMFKMARAGNFGTIFGKLDGETIMSWMALYLDRKYDKLEQIHQNAKHQQSEIAPEVVEVLKDAIENRPEPVKQVISDQEWRQWFEQEKENLTTKQLEDLRAKLEDMAVLTKQNHYEKELKWINEKIN